MRGQTDRIEQVGKTVIDSAFKVHTALGPGLLESTYGLCLTHEIKKAGLSVRREMIIPIQYDDLTVENGYRIDLVVDNQVVVELKAVEAILPVHRGQVLSYLRLGKFKLGYLLNFNVAHMRDGITRLVNGL
jgi:GxxExxY protein